METTPISWLVNNDASRVNGLIGCSPARSTVAAQSMSTPACAGTIELSVVPARTGTGWPTRGPSAARSVASASWSFCPPISTPATVTPRGTRSDETAKSTAYATTATAATPPATAAYFAQRRPPDASGAATDSGTGSGSGSATGSGAGGGSSAVGRCEAAGVAAKTSVGASETSSDPSSEACGGTAGMISVGFSSGWGPSAPFSRPFPGR